MQREQLARTFLAPRRVRGADGSNRRWNIGGRGVEVPKKYKDFVASKRGQFVRQLLAVGPAVAFALTCMLAHMRGELTYDVAMQVLVVQLVMVRSQRGRALARAHALAPALSWRARARRGC